MKDTGRGIEEIQARVIRENTSTGGWQVYREWFRGGTGRGTGRYRQGYG